MAAKKKPARTKKATTSTKTTTPAKKAATPPKATAPAKKAATSAAAPTPAKNAAAPAKKTAKKAVPAPARAAEPKKPLNEIQKKTTGKLVKLAESVIGQIARRNGPSIAVPSRNLANTFYDERKRIVQLGAEKTNRSFFNASMAKKFMQTFLVADSIKDLIESGKTTSIRDLYYMTLHTMGDSKVKTFDDQDESDPIIEDLEVTVNSLREELHLFATNRGSMVGNMTIVDGGDTIDLRRMGTGGWNIPSIVEAETVQFKDCEAKFVVLVEKDAVFRRFNEDKFWKKNNCILLTGQGQPPRGVRRILRRMNEELKLPIYVLVDNDPWGFYIYSVIKQGSINLAYESMRMAVPSARFIGLSSFDREKYDLPDTVRIDLDDGDIARTKQMLAYKWFDKPEWKRELDYMIKTGIKMEIEALSSKGISFVTEEYFPKKLRDRDWLE